MGLPLPRLLASGLVEGAWEGDVFCLESLVEKCANGSPVDPVLDISSDVDVDASCAACTNFAWKLQFSKCGRAVRGNRGRHCAKEGMWNCMCCYAAESSIERESGVERGREHERVKRRMRARACTALIFPLFVVVAIAAAPHFLQRTCLSLSFPLSCSLCVCLCVCGGLHPDLVTSGACIIFLLYTNIICAFYKRQQQQQQTSATKILNK